MPRLAGRAGRSKVILPNAGQNISSQDEERQDIISDGIKNTSAAPTNKDRQCNAIED
jgi:hypothetical protein